MKRMKLSFENKLIRGPWVAQLVTHLTLNFSSGHDLRGEMELHIRLCTRHKSLLVPLALLLPPHP